MDLLAIPPQSLLCRSRIAARRVQCARARCRGAAGPLRAGVRALGAREALAQFGRAQQRTCSSMQSAHRCGITSGVDFDCGRGLVRGIGRVIELIMEYAPQPLPGRGVRQGPTDLAAARAALQQAMTGVSA